MTDQDLNREWAQSQLEAWADGSLSSANLERLNAALQSDAQLRAAAERAVAVRGALRERSRGRLPAGLRLRLLAIPGKPFHSWHVALPAAASALAIIGVAFLLWPAAPPPPPDPRVVAIQEFELAMRYLQKSARMTENGVTIAVGTGLREALTASRESLARTTEETGG